MPVADLRSVPGVFVSSYSYDSFQESQLLYGELVKILAAENQWLKIEAVEQMEFSHANRWQGYPGWILKSAVMPVKKISPANFIVQKKVTHLYSAPDSRSSFLPLSIGTKCAGLPVLKKGFRKIKKVGGKFAWIPKEDVRLSETLLSQEMTRKKIIGSATEFLGDLYFWGGRSAHIPELQKQITAVDCSGLANLSYRVAGIDIPRDSYEQFLKAKKIKREELKMGDLIFSASKEKPEQVSHVAIFLDQEYLIEAPKTGERVRKITYQEKYGVPFDQLREDVLIGDRFIYFGTYFEDRKF